MLPTTHQHCNISLKGAVLPGCNDAEMGPANLLHALVYYTSIIMKERRRFLCLEGCWRCITTCSNILFIFSALENSSCIAVQKKLQQISSECECYNTALPKTVRILDVVCALFREDINYLYKCYVVSK